MKGRQSGAAGPWIVRIALVCLSLLIAARAGAQDVRFEALVNARECDVLLAHDGRLYGGVAEGGVLVWDAADPNTYTHWTVADGLTGLRVVSLAWTGQNLWVASREAGLTRVTLGGGGPSFRQYTNIGGLDVTAVTGFVPGTSETVYYGLREGGVGIINGGLPGVVYDTGYGLVSDSVRALTIHRGALWVGTVAGISRFAGNVFTTESAGLPDSSIQTFCSSGDTLLLAGTPAGVARWDSTAGAWRTLGPTQGSIISLAVQGGVIWALRDGPEPAGPTLWAWDGAAWTQADVPLPVTRALAAEPGAAGRLWAAGGHTDPEMDFRTGRAFVAVRGTPGWNSWVTNELIFLAADGCAFAPDGSAWVGSRLGLAVGRHGGDGRWTQVWQVASAANDSMGLMAHGANILSMVALPNGEIWFSQCGAGVVRLLPGDPSVTTDDRFEFLTTANSGLPANCVRRIIRHPDGPLIFVTDTAGASALIDPARWREPAQWVSLPTGTPGLGGSAIPAAVVARRDQVWFAVGGVGLVKWDINGGAGPDAALTWTDPSDDDWDPPVASLPPPTDSATVTAAVGLAAAADGSLWAGSGKGVVHFLPTGFGSASLLGFYGEKKDVFVEGLLSVAVHDIQLDRNGDLWVGFDGVGLNRIRLRDDGTHIDAYTDIASYYAYNLGRLYLSSIISGIPGGQVWELAADPSGSRILVGSDGGAAVLDIVSSDTGAGQDLSSLYLYPNPMSPKDAGTVKLKLGGITTPVSGDGLTGGVAVRIYTMAGQLVYSDDHVANDTGFWDGRNVSEKAVASGLYLVRVTFGGRHAVRTLAVVR